MPSMAASAGAGAVRARQFQTRSTACRPAISARHRHVGKRKLACCRRFSRTCRAGPCRRRLFHKSWPTPRAAGTDINLVLGMNVLNASTKSGSTTMPVPGIFRLATCDSQSGGKLWRPYPERARSGHSRRAGRIPRPRRPPMSAPVGILQAVADVGFALIPDCARMANGFTGAVCLYRCKCRRSSRHLE